MLIRRAFQGGGRQYATWNPSDKSANITLSLGNLRADHPGSAYDFVRATVGKSSGKWYWEVYWNSGTLVSIGVATNVSSPTGNWLGVNAETWGVMSVNGFHYNNNVAVDTMFSPMSNATTYGFALDMDAGALTVYKNNVIGSSTISGLSGKTIYPATSSFGGANQVTANFGASAFTYTPPSGYTAGVY